MSGGFEERDMDLDFLLVVVASPRDSFGSEKLVAGLFVLVTSLKKAVGAF